MELDLEHRLRRVGLHSLAHHVFMVKRALAAILGCQADQVTITGNYTTDNTPPGEDELGFRFDEITINAETSIRISSSSPGQLAILAACERLAEANHGDNAQEDDKALAMLKATLRLPDAESMLGSIRQFMSIADQSPGMTIIMALSRLHDGAAITTLGNVLRGYIQYADGGKSS